jgi:hypothetical protein
MPWCECKPLPRKSSHQITGTRKEGCDLGSGGRPVENGPQARHTSRGAHLVLWAKDALGEGEDGGGLARAGWAIEEEMGQLVIVHESVHCAEVPSCDALAHEGRAAAVLLPSLQGKGHQSNAVGSVAGACRGWAASHMFP